MWVRDEGNRRTSFWAGVTEVMGVIGNVGFSTHAPYRIICEAISTGLFDFVNLHYYYFLQRNFGAVELAAAHDMGVFIISPNDKGGQLFAKLDGANFNGAMLQGANFNGANAYGQTAGPVVDTGHSFSVSAWVSLLVNSSSASPSA